MIGNGNVAADVARMLAITHDELRETDTADHAIAPLADKRRHARSSCSDAEDRPRLRSPTPSCGSSARWSRQTSTSTRRDCELDELSREFLDSDDADITSRKNVEIFTEFAARPPEGKPKRIALRFLRSPVEIHGDGRVERIVVAVNELYRDESGAIRARDTGEREEIECGLVLRSIGYRGTALEGLPFDERRGVIANEGGRVIERESGRQVSGPLRRRLDQAGADRASSAPTRRTPRRRSTTCSRTSPPAASPSPRWPPTAARSRSSWPTAGPAT